MLFSGAKILNLGLSILSCIAARPIYPRLPPGQLIGYRTTRPAQAAKWIKAGTVTPDDNINGIQIGEGAYTSPVIGDWIGAPTYQYCAISADSNAWNAISKAWIPEIGPDGNKLWGDESQLFAQDKYLERLGLDPAKTIRMSLIDTRRDKDEPLDKLDKLQMVIPNTLTNFKGGGLNLKVECHQTIEEFDDNTPDIDYYYWKNVHGEPQYPACT
ncbi:hypothetical protein N7510_000108 [Penicillium lagena]|uniref:uncharacterized protein n=1 Tax=Penicillium lagena TaxID=94218 RepID=UPI00253F7950|nr:uncharacterized protein N7510_000108 [Penicillium lagena]KAJ5623799.1 hypothetical protein N7510_000108 [Penicillium lagena]